jgi:hypothetical protein
MPTGSDRFRIPVAVLEAPRNHVAFRVSGALGEWLGECHEPSACRTPCKTWRVSIFDELEAASMATAPAGYQARQRRPLPDVTVEQLDAKVIGAGGQLVRVPMQPGQLGAGRMVASAVEAHYYVIPDAAFDG